MDLYLLRHGQAGQYGDPQYKDDSLRPLTTEGQQRLRHASKGMKNLGLDFDLILTSPYLRAKQTAQIVAKAYKIKQIHLTDTLLPPTKASSLLREINKHYPKAQRILAVGHEPHLTQLLSEFLQSKKHLRVEFKKGGLCYLSIRQSSTNPEAILNWLLTPAQLELLSKI